jgi:hypothetical protein
MANIEGICRDVCEAPEFVTIVTIADDGAELANNKQVQAAYLGI